MFNSRVLAVIKRELRDKLFSKGFVLMTVLLPLFMIGIISVQTFLFSYEGDEKSHLLFVAETNQLKNELQNEFEKLAYVKSGHYVLTYETMGKDDFKNYLKENKSKLINEKLTGIVFIPSTALTDKKVEYYSKNPTNHSIFSKLRTTINKVLVDEYFTGKQFSDKDISYARESVDFSGFKVSKDEKIEEAGLGGTIISFLFTFLLYLSLLVLGTMMMRAVVEEKNNRIVEVLLSSVSSKELMTGKILGNAVTGLLQMAIWLLPVFLIVSSSIFVLPAELTINLSIGQLLYFLLNYLIGVVTFLGLFASVGAIFNNDQDAQSGMWPIMMLIMIPFFIAISLGNNPASPIARIASMLPFASIIVMPARMALVDVPVWQFALSIVVNLTTLAIIFTIAGKIYRVGILITGKKPKWSEVIKWVKLKY